MPLLRLHPGLGARLHGAAKVKWGTPATYAHLWKHSGPTYKNELMFWLQMENPQLFELTKKEIARDRDKRPAASRQVQDRGGEGGQEDAGWGI